ncbi:MAG: DUF11 domain-containing protein [Ardenticatenales bacterium]|nr:DUF11 domain-containing protein [Ardenticatenales bacterium]
MTRVWLRRFSLLAGIFLTLPLILLAPNTTPPAAAFPLITALHASPAGIQFQLDIPSYQQQDGHITADGLTATLRQPGAPILPIFQTFILLPPGADAVVRVRQRQVSQAILPPLAAEPYPAGPAPAGNQPAAITAPDPAIYDADALFPAQIYALSAPMYVRDARLVQLTLYPFRYNPAQQTLQFARSLDVEITFAGGNGTDAQLPPQTMPAQWSHQILNANQLDHWRGLPPDFAPPGPYLPLGVDTYKIEVAADGIYEIGYADLQAAGMNVAAVNPHTFHLMRWGDPVAYQFVGDGDNQFEADEKIRFFGWVSGRSRLELQYIANNLFWLWADDTADLIADAGNITTYPAATTWLSSVTAEPIGKFFSTWTDNWDEFPNEPDAWFWERLDQLNRSYTVNLPHPAAAGPDATFTAEFNTREDSSSVTVTMNGQPNPATGSWSGLRNENVSGAVPLSAVVNGSNTFDVTVNRTHHFYLNRITVDYTRLFIADDDELLFSDEVGGARRFDVQGFSGNDPDAVFVWDISDRAQPVNIPMTAANISGTGPYTYTFGTSHDAGTQYLVTTQIHQPAGITQVIPASLDPADGQADWLAIVYPDLMDAANVLAAHRQDPRFGGYGTHLVRITDVIDQFGAGMPTPAAVQNFLAYALANWTTPPRYVTLVGDATDNPNHDQSNSFPDDNEPQFVPTGLEFVDRFQGRIPTDFPMTLLVGDDLLPDVALGRIAAQSPTEATNVINKIILYEQNQLMPASWQQNILFVADDGSSFCQENHDMASHFPASFNTVVDPLCLPDNPTGADVEAILATLQLDYLSNPNSGAPLFHYRGHGGITQWGAEPAILNTANTSFWSNGQKPTVILSADCLDGYFAAPGLPGLGETFLRGNAGTAAHWSSTGLAYPDEHTVLLDAFYDSLFLDGDAAIGDAISAAKIAYLNTGRHTSLLYTFTLQGDPAMHLMRPDLHLAHSADPPQAAPGDLVTFVLTVTNNGIYPVKPTILNQLSAGLTFIRAYAAAPLLVDAAGSQVSVTVDEAMEWGDSVTLYVEARVDGGFAGNQVSNQAFVTSPGLDNDDGDNAGTAIIPLVGPTTTPPPPITPTPGNQQPDLQIVGELQMLSGPPVYANEPVLIGVTIKNAGVVNITQPFDVDVFLDPPFAAGDPITPDEVNLYTSGFVHVPQLAAGATQTVQVTTLTGFTPAATAHEVFALVDSQAQVAESDESNNLAGPLLTLDAGERNNNVYLPFMKR